MPKRKRAIKRLHKPIHHGLKKWFFGPKGFYWNHMEAIATVISLMLMIAEFTAKYGHIPMA